MLSSKARKSWAMRNKKPRIWRISGHKIVVSLKRQRQRRVWRIRRRTLPVASYCEPWHGQMYLSWARFHGTTQPRWVQTALMA
eukprot:6188176-Pleurochrysis_carterae.AAC.2